MQTNTCPPKISPIPLLKLFTLMLNFFTHHFATTTNYLQIKRSRKGKMDKNRNALLRLVLVMCCYMLVVTGGSFEGEGGRRSGGGDEGGEGGKRERGEWFLLKNSKSVVKTKAGEMRVVRGIGGRFVERPMHIGFITMESRSLFIPQYLDSSLIIFIRRGEARIGSIRKDELVEKRLRTGDVYRIEAGSAFYIENTGEGQRLHVICSIDTSTSLNWHAFQSYFIGGGTYPTSILFGFDLQTLSLAFNVSTAELMEIRTSQKSGAIVSLSPDSHPPSSVWTRFLDLEHHERKVHLKKFVQFHEDAESEEDRPKWSLRKLLISIFGKENRKKDDSRTESHDTYNLYDRSPDFKNNYGWSLAVDESDFAPLSRSGIGLYLVNLTAGAMMAPHINPTATEYGIVLRGSGSIQIVYPNGTLAMNARVSEGDVFWIPRYFPFCQISSTNGPFEFFGFTTSSRKSHPQFLVGQNSLLQSMMGPEFAASFGLSEERLRRFVDAQRDSTILSTAAAAPPDHEEERGEMIPKMIKNFGNDMVMGF